eukprot:m.12335 g.12335  ORF g.12335 m.12335 type:complete len:65 (+) comp7165_c0_seq2:386-580(+)
MQGKEELTRSHSHSPQSHQSSENETKREFKCDTAQHAVQQCNAMQCADRQSTITPTNVIITCEE